MKRSDFIEKRDKLEGVKIATPRESKQKKTPRYTAIHHRESSTVFDASTGKDVFESPIAKECTLYASWHNEHLNE